MSFTPRQLLAMAERALDVLDWGQVYALASDVLVLEPGNAEAGMLRALAERHGGRGSLPGRRQATALFADLVGSTRVAEQHDVEIYSGVLSMFVEACRPAIENHEGHVVDVQGDGIVACFGYPHAHEDDACRAVTAGLDMLAALRPVAAALRAERDIALQVRVGVDTGLVVVDGAAVSGGTMNRAARLQSLAAPDTVLISAATNELVAERFETRALGPQQLKGFAAPIEVFRVLRPYDCSRYGPTRHSPALPFIGRDGELRQVLSVWQRMLASRLPGNGRVQPSLGQMMLIVGGPGIGKSRLASVVVERIASEATRVVKLHCSEYCVTSTLFPLRAAIEGYIDVRPGDGDDERLMKLEAACADLGVESAELIPALGALFGFELNGRYPPLDLSPVQLQKVLLDRLTAALPAIAANGPAILVFEDLQWADPTTLEVLDRLAAAGLPAGLLILGTARPGLQWMPSYDTVQTIRLDPLPAGQACELAKAAGSTEMSEQDAREIAARGDGVPLFVEQLAHTFGELGAPALVDDADAVPGTLIQLLQARLDSVGPAKLIAQVAATIGRVFHTSVLEGVMANLAPGSPPDAPDTRVEQHLKQLADAQLIEPMDHGQLRFRHVLMRDAAYQSQLMRDRRARHAAVAALLTEANPADSALTAFHFDHADRPLDALVHYLQAVRRAQAAGAFPEVFAHLRRCEQLLADVPDENVRARFELAVRLNRGVVVTSTAGFTAPGVVADYKRARDLCTILDEVPGVANELLGVLFAVWNYYCASGDFTTTPTICSAIERQLESTTTRSGGYVLDACRGVEDFYRGELQRAGTLLSRAVVGMSRDGIDPDDWWWQPQDPLSASWAHLGLLRFLAGDEAGALEAIRAGLTRSRPLEFPKGPFSVAYVRTYESMLHRARGDVPAAVTAAEEALRIGERHGFAVWQIVGKIHLSAARAMAGGSSGVLDEMGVALATWRAIGAETEIPWLLVEQGEGYLLRDDVEKAADCLAKSFEVMRRGQLFGLPNALQLRAELHLRAAPAAMAAADADLREAIMVAQAQGNVYWSLRAALTHRRRLHSEGGELVDAALAEAVMAYRDAAAFPDLVQARELVGDRPRIRQG